MTMDDKNNPYASNGGYAANVQYGAAPAASPQAGKDLIKDTTTASFSVDVIQESRRQPVLVDFWAPWCGPCKQLTPLLEKAVQAAGGRVKLVKMNTEEHPAIAGQLGIQSIPTVIAFKNGQPVDGFMGVVPESQIRDFIQRVGGKADNGGEGVAEALAAAAEARDAGDPTTAAEIYSALMEQSPETLEAIAGLAELMFEAGNVQGALAVLDGAPDEKKDAPVLAAVRAKISLAEQAASLGEAAEFERRLAADPKDHQARFDLAMIQNAEGKRMEAADNLLAIVKVDRTWKDDGARAQLLKFFEAWGPTDEVTLAARRKLSSILFS
jgi:putative thioredoxin